MVHIEPLVDFLDLALALGLVALGVSILWIVFAALVCTAGGNENENN